MGYPFTTWLRWFGLFALLFVVVMGFLAWWWRALLPCLDPDLEVHPVPEEWEDDL